MTGAGTAEVRRVGGGVDGMAVFQFPRHLIPTCNVDTIRRRKRVPEQLYPNLQDERDESDFCLRLPAMHLFLYI